MGSDLKGALLMTLRIHPLLSPAESFDFLLLWANGFTQRLLVEQNVPACSAWFDEWRSRSGTLYTLWQARFSRSIGEALPVFTLA